MEELVKSIVLSLVDEPDSVSVTTVEKDGETIVELRVAESDIGKVIGRQGRIAKAIRTVVKAASIKNGKPVGVEIVQ